MSSKSAHDDDGVLTPEDLQLDDDRVDELGENRYVVRSDRSTPEDATLLGDDHPLSSERLGDDENENETGTGFTTAIAAVGDVPATDVSSAAIGASELGIDLERPDSSADSSPGARSSGHPLEAAAEPHGIDVTLKTDGELAHLNVTSHDVREVFVELLTWYAGQLDDDLTPAQALEVMLATSDLDV